MILIITNIVLMGLRWLCHTVRYGRYANAMQKMLSHSSFFIERASSKTESSISAMKLLNSSTSFKGMKGTLLEDSYLRIHQMEAMVDIDLTNWIAYKFKGKPIFPEGVRLLVEARTAKTLNDSGTQEFGIANSLHILSCGRTVAWRAEEPFGIIMACDVPDLLQLVDAFGQGTLMLAGDGLETTGLATVRTKGSPQHLISKEADVMSFSQTIQEQIIQKEQSKLSCATVINDKPSQSGILEDGTDETQEDEGLTKSLETEIVNTKPPNILIYCGVKDSARKFAEAKSSLQSCVNTDAYVLYLLNHDNLVSSPWQRNTAALVITSCAHLRSDAEQKIDSFVRHSKGKVISFNSSIDKCFSSQVKSSVLKTESSERLIDFSFKTWHDISSVSGPNVYSRLNDQADVLIPLGIPANRRAEAEPSCGSKDELNSCISPASGTNANYQVRASECCDEDALVVKISVDGGGTTILSQLLLERDPLSFAIDDKAFTVLKKSNAARLEVLKELLGHLDIDTNPGPIPKLTCCHLVARKAGLRESFLDSLKRRLDSTNILKSKKMSLRFYAPHNEAEIRSDLLPVTTDCDAYLKSEFFDLQSYWDNLNSRCLGHLVFYTDVITSTMTVFDSLLFSIPSHVGPVAIAGRQTSGRGRAGNAWLSPVGCAMFTFPLSFTLDSELGGRLSCLQHLITVAVMQSVLTLPGYEAINIRLKWPNDIYFGREIKLGGVMVTSTVMGNDVCATIGCGFNVSNSNPTTCINDIINQHNNSNPDSPPLQPLSAGQLLGRTMTILESLIDDFQRNGSDNFFQLYYKYWLHGGTRVKIELDTKTEGEIVGLDKNGFLSLRTTSGKLISVQPDGNSFDMMHNLIHFKATS